MGKPDHSRRNRRPPKDRRPTEGENSGDGPKRNGKGDNRKNGKGNNTKNEEGKGNLKPGNTNQVNLPPRERESKIERERPKMTILKRPEIQTTGPEKHVNESSLNSMSSLHSDKDKLAMFTNIRPLL